MKPQQHCCLALAADAVRGVLIEKNYIDKDYRNTYYNFYAKKGQKYRPDCIRLHFFDSTVSFSAAELRLVCSDRNLDHHYFGYMVLRPTGMSTIGRTVLTPDVRMGSRGRVVTAKHKVHLLGYKLVIEGFPSMDQHSDISVCAHAACWSVLRHYSESYTNYREFLTHDITMMAQPFNPGGLVPSKGLEISHAERVFQAAGTFPVIVTRKKVNDVVFDRLMLAYIESGFPLFAAMHKWGHAVALVGYEWDPSSRRKPKKLSYAWDAVCAIRMGHRACHGIRLGL
jgi:hypothetical protein